jgi:hypothetical protein
VNRRLRQLAGGQPERVIDHRRRRFRGSAAFPAARERPNRRMSGGAVTSWVREGSTAAHAKPTQQKESVLPDYILIPLLLVLMSVALVALIYWGGFVEERRNGRGAS